MMLNDRYIALQKGGDEWIVVKTDRSLYFPAVERFRRTLTKISGTPEGDTSSRTIVLDMSRVSHIDHTSLRVNWIVCRGGIGKKAKAAALFFILCIFRC